MWFRRIFPFIVSEWITSWTFTVLKGRQQAQLSNGISIRALGNDITLSIQSMCKILKVGFIGGGKMAQAMAKGILSSGLLWFYLNCWFERNFNRLRKISARYQRTFFWQTTFIPIDLGLTKSEAITASAHPSDEASLKAFRDLGAKAVTENRCVVEKSDVVFLAVKPNILPTCLREFQNISSGKLFVSVAMGVTLTQIEKILACDSRVIRCMPNTPAIVQAAASVFVRGTKATNEDAELVRKLLESMGMCDEVSEYMMDPVTALSGSGPAYVRNDLFANLLQSFYASRFTDFCANWSAGRWRRENGTAERSSISSRSANSNWIRETCYWDWHTSRCVKGQRYIARRKHCKRTAPSREKQFSKRNYRRCRSCYWEVSRDLRESQMTHSINHNSSVISQRWSFAESYEAAVINRWLSMETLSTQLSVIEDIPVPLRAAFLASDFASNY